MVTLFLNKLRESKRGKQGFFTSKSFPSLLLLTFRIPCEQRLHFRGIGYIQDRGFNSFLDNKVKLSVDRPKWQSLLARIRLFFFSFWFEYLITGPFSFGHFRETAPWPGCSNAGSAPVVSISGEANCTIIQCMDSGSLPFVRGGWTGKYIHKKAN